jgi:hypothetical protein
MGASDNRLIEYFRWWEENRALPRRESGREIEGDWHRYVGEAEMFAALSDFFRQQVLDRGSAEVVTTVFPIVSRGVAAAALHGLIRLAYGIKADHAGEIAAGLATLCSRYVDLGLEFDERSSASVDAAFGRLADAIGGAAFAGQGIIGRMIAAASDYRFREAISMPPITPGQLGEIAGASIALYWLKADFTVLHMVTATHAARILFDRYPNLATQHALRSLWGAVCAAYASVGAPLLTEVVVQGDVPSWNEVFAGAILSNDDHVIKMSYTCHCEAKHYRNPIYQAAAARLVEIGSSLD